MTDPIAPWPGELLDCDGTRLFVRGAPAGPGAAPALFVHGLGGSSRNWTDLMDLLRDRPPAARPAGAAGPLDLREPAPPGEHAATGEPAEPGEPGLAAEALDLPGFGHSPAPPDGRYTVSAHAAAVIALISTRGNWPVHLIGNSLGGAICTRVAARRPDLVRTLTLVSPALPDLRPRLLPSRIAIAATPGIGPWLLRRLQQVPAQARSDRSLRDIYCDPALMHPDRRAEETQEIARRDTLDYAADALMRSTRGLVAEYARPRARSLWADATRVAAPVLVLHGSHDRLVNPVMAARAARMFRDARVVLLPRVGHVAMMERPDLVAGEMREFLGLRGCARETATPARC